MLLAMKAPRNQLIALLALLAIALFPFGWLTELSSAADLIGDTLFPNEAAHAVGHALIFGAIGAALLIAFPPLRRRPWLYLGLILIVAVGQEGIQLIYKERGVVVNDLTDIGTDLVAAALVWALWYSKGQHDAQRANRKTRAA